jgi:TatD DNase family protein
MTGSSGQTGEDGGTPLVDAHAHPWAIREVLSDRCPGVVVLLNSTGLDDLETTLSYKRRAERSLFFAGIHPTSPRQEPAPFEVWAEEHKEEIDGVGEIGLDARAELGESRRCFNSQLELASRLRKPVAVHSRGRIPEVLEDLSRYKLKVLLHWFDGTKEELSASADRGYFVSFGPPLSYSRRMAGLLRATPLDGLLLETDSPVRYPSCYESRESTPMMIASVYLAASFLRGIGAKELEGALAANARAFLSRSAL